MQRIRCQYQRTLFRNEEDGYTIFSAKTKEDVQTKDKFGNIICEGYLPLFPIGVGLVLNGDFINRKKGTRFHARNYRLQFDNEAAAIAFLSSHTFDDITPATAEKIVKEIGSDVFAYAATQDAARNLCKSVSGLDVVASNKLISRIREMSRMQEMILFMLSIGGGYINAEKICKKYGEKATVAKPTPAYGQYPLRWASWRKHSNPFLPNARTDIRNNPGPPPWRRCPRTAAAAARTAGIPAGRSRPPSGGAVPSWRILLRPAQWCAPWCRRRPAAGSRPTAPPPFSGKRPPNPPGLPLPPSAARCAAG